MADANLTKWNIATNACDWKKTNAKVMECYYLCCQTLSKEHKTETCFFLMNMT